MSSYLSPQFKYMIFHIFICILHFLRVNYELTMWPATGWLDSSVGRALHRYRRSHGIKSLSGLNCFQTLISQLLKFVCITAMSNHVFISFSAVQIYDLSYIHLHSSLSTGILRTHKVTSSQLAWYLTGRAPAPVSQRSWVRIPFRPVFFQSLISQLLKLCV